MTNKFRDTQKTLDDYGEWLTREEFLTIKKALTIAAELQDAAETIKALDEAGRSGNADQWHVYLNDRDVNNEQDGGIVTSGGISIARCPRYAQDAEWMLNGGFIAKMANDARPVIKKLAKLVKEGE